jgi:uncharacterized protein (UPF0276 family)
VRKNAAQLVCAHDLRATRADRPAAARCAIFQGMDGFARLGHGLGLRPPFYEAAAAGTAPVDWWEAITENFLGPGGNPRRVLRAARAHRPIVLHGVAMSLGSTDPLDARYLDQLAALAREIEPAWISDHLCWSSLGGHRAHDLWPLPFTEEALAHVAARVARVQERLGRRILVENVSSYLTYRHSTIGEAEFLAALAARADCGILLDVNNVFVSAHNHGFDPIGYLDAVPRARVGQFHLAGHETLPTHLRDTHDHPVADAVWDLYRHGVARFGDVATLLERDDRIPPLEELCAELERARDIARTVTSGLAETSTARATNGGRRA